MKKNLGTIDRTIRILVGLAALGLGYHYHSYWGLLGLLPLTTGLVGFCPAYCPFGLKTCKDSGKSR
jgi:hypothetical protein